MISSDYITQKATEKMNKYVVLQIECEPILEQKCWNYPCVIDATGMVEKNLKKKPGRIAGHLNIHNLRDQQSSEQPIYYRKYYILQKVLSIKPD